MGMADHGGLQEILLYYVILSVSQLVNPTVPRWSKYGGTDGRKAEVHGGLPGSNYLDIIIIAFLFLIANIVTTSKALVTRSDALVTSSFLLLLVRHLLLEAMHLLLVASCYY